MRDIDQIIHLVQQRNPSVTVTQLRSRNHGDDDGLWFFNQPDCSFEVQLESPFGMCPFLIETDENDRRITAKSISEAIEALTELLHFH